MGTVTCRALNADKSANGEIIHSDLVCANVNSSTHSRLNWRWRCKFYGRDNFHKQN